MNLVIPYKQQGEGVELRYAIRSIAKYFKDLTGCIVVGDKPEWYTGEHIPFGDEFGRKEFSIYQKLIQVQGTVLYSNDDFFALKPFDSSLPFYYSGKVKSYSGTDKRYRDLYRACLPNWLNFDVHAPMIIDTTKFEWICDRPIKTYYANQNGLPGTEIFDLKITGKYLYSQYRNMIKGRPFFSTKDNEDCPNMLRLWNELYPEKSPYET